MYCYLLTDLHSHVQRQNDEGSTGNGSCTPLNRLALKQGSEVIGLLAWWSGGPTNHGRYGDSHEAGRLSVTMAMTPPWTSGM
jgi:hypothetical protein